MNPDKPLRDPSKAKHTDDDADHIPILDEALDLPTELGEHEATPSAAGDALELPSEGSSHDLELDINLGYAEETEDYVENDDLAEMDEIQTLPLAEMVLDDSQDSLVSAEQKQQIATLEAIVFDGGNPNAPAPKKSDRVDEKSNIQAEREPVPVPEEDKLEFISSVTPPPVSPPLTKPLPKKSENPFLPQHILDRLNQGKRNLVEEIAQSSAALDASTAILRTHARAERLTKPTYSEARPQHSFSRDKSAQQKQKMVDDLVEEYLPLIAAELRRRLRKLLDE
jgi:hypothetical protein